MVSRSAREKKQFPLFSPFPLFLLFFQFRLNLFFLNAEMHVACLRKALEMEPENPTALYRLAMSYPEGSPERVQYFEQGLRSGSTSCGVLLLEETQGELDERQYLNAVGRIGMLCGATHERFNHLEELINIVQRTADERTRYDAAKILLDWREIDVRGFRLHNLRSEQLELTRSEIEWYLRRVELYRRAALTWIWAARHIPEAKDICDSTVLRIAHMVYAARRPPGEEVIGNASKDIEQKEVGEEGKGKEEEVEKSEGNDGEENVKVVVGDQEEATKVEESVESKDKEQVDVPDSKIEEENPEDKVEAQLDEKAEAKTDEKVEAEAETEEKVEVKAKEKVEAESEEKVEGKLEETAEAKPEEKGEAQPEAGDGAEAKLEEKVESTPEETVDAKPEAEETIEKPEETLEASNQVDAAIDDAAAAESTPSNEGETATNPDNDYNSEDDDDYEKLTAL